MDILEAPRNSIQQADLEALEKHFGSRLPVSYRHFLLKSNGGECYKSFIFDDGNSCFVADFFGIIGENSPNYDTDDILGVYRLYRKSNWIPKDSIFIADNGGSSKILMSLQENSYGQIFLWDKYKLNTDFEGNLVSDFPNLEWLCNSFEELLQALDLEDIQCS